MNKAQFTEFILEQYQHDRENEPDGPNHIYFNCLTIDEEDVLYLGIEWLHFAPSDYTEEANLLYQKGIEYAPEYKQYTAHVFQYNNSNYNGPGEHIDTIQETSFSKLINAFYQQYGKIIIINQQERIEP